MGNVDSIMTARRCPLLVLIDTSCRKTPLLTSGGLASGAGGGYCRQFTIVMCRKGS